MDFAQHLVNYYKGEWLEAVLLTAFGISAAGAAIAVWPQTDQNALLKGFVYPLAFMAAFTVLTGSWGVYNNTQRLASLPAQHTQNATAFVQAETTRFQGNNGVNAWWLPLKLLWAATAVVGIAMAFGARGETAQGVAIGLICIGAMGFLIDGFAHRRAQIYTAALLAQPAAPTPASAVRR